MLGLLMPESWRRAERERQKREAERRVKLAVPWDPSIKWQRELQFRAETYEPTSLWDVRPCSSIYNLKPGQSVLSPSGRFIYVEKRLPAGEMLTTMSGNRRGTVLFDGPVRVPCLYEYDSYAERWSEEPWMGLTPMEIMTLRPGTRRARGRVIVAGLGLGHQLIEVSKKRSVKHLVLVERSRELVDWLLPRVRPHLGRELDDVVVGDANEVMPEMSADVALLDIYKRYGWNGDERDRLKRACPDVKFMWAWGCAAVGGSIWD